VMAKGKPWVAANGDVARLVCSRTNCHQRSIRRARGSGACGRGAPLGIASTEVCFLPARREARGDSMATRGHRDRRDEWQLCGEICAMRFGP
jgi:hypothetical protein